MKKTLVNFQHDLARRWNQVNTPIKLITNPYERNTARQVSRLSIILALVGCVLVLVSNRWLLLNTTAMGVIGICTVFMVSAFFINRTRYYRYAPILIVATLQVGVFGAYMARPTSIPERTLNYLLLVIFIATRIIPLRTSIMVCAVNLLGIVLMPVFIASVYTLESSFTFNSVVSVTILFVMFHRQRDLQRIMDNESRYRNLMEANYEPIAITDLNGSILDVNTAFERLSGYKRSDLTGRNILSMVSPSSFQKVQENWTTNKMPSIRITAPTASGTVLPLEVRSRKYEYAGAPAFVIIARDLTYETEIERQKHEYELRYQALFNNTNDGVYILDLDGNNLAANEQGLKLMGLTDEEYRKSRVVDNVATSEIDDSLNTIRRLMNNENLPVYTRKFKRRHGQVSDIWIGEVSAMLVRDLDGTPMYLQSVVRDVTERERSEQERLDSAVQEERHNLLKQLIDDFSHHVRTPLANVKNSRYLIPKYHGQREKQEHHLNIIDTEIMRMVNLLDDLLMLTRIEPESDRQTIQPLDLNELLAQILPLPLGIAKEDPAHQWIFEPEQTPVVIYGNQTRLIDAFSRLFFNARTYTPVDGTIRIAIQSLPTIKAVRVSIHDTGVGIAEDELPHIFENFYRSDTARNINPNSSGLGLCICRKIIDIHRGLIEVVSKEGVGSTFSVWLPTDILTTISYDKIALVADYEMQGN